MHPKKGKAPVREQKEFEEEVIQIDRVTRVVKGGRRLRFRATVVIGNKKGKVGMGIGKSSEVTGAIQKAIAQAKKDLVRIPIVGQTIPHRVDVKYKSAKLILLPACPGTGIIAGGPLRKIIELAGVKDVMAKCLGTNNRVANTQAGVKALAELREIPWIARKQAAAKEAAKKAAQEKKAAAEKAAAEAKKSEKKEKPAAKKAESKAAPKKEAPKKEESKKEA